MISSCATLPAARVLYGALAIPWTIRRQLVSALALPGFIYVLFGALGEQSQDSLIQWLMWGAQWPAITLCLVAVQRHVLLSAEDAEEDHRYHWGVREWECLIAALALWFAVQVLGGVLRTLDALLGGGTTSLPAMTFLGSALLLTGLLAVYARASLVLPSIALNQGLNFRRAWALGEGQTLPLMAALYLPAILLLWVPNLLWQDTPSMGRSLAGETVSALCWIIQLTALALSWQWLQRRPNKDTSPSS